MEGPDEDFRVDLAHRRYETEGDVEEVLSAVLERLGYQDDEAAEHDPYRELAAIEEWASLASYAVSRFYGPQSPLRTDIAGWSRKAVERLREIVESLRPRLALARELAAGTPTTPDTAALHAVADRLARVIAAGDTDQTKALLRILIAELRLNSRNEILPTYRVGAPVVCAQTSSVELVGLEPTTSSMPWKRSSS